MASYTKLLLSAFCMHAADETFICKALLLEYGDLFMQDLEIHFSDSIAALQCNSTNMQMQAHTYLICEIESNWSPHLLQYKQ